MTTTFNAFMKKTRADHTQMGYNVPNEQAFPENFRVWATEAARRYSREMDASAVEAACKKEPLLRELVAAASQIVPHHEITSKWFASFRSSRGTSKVDDDEESTHLKTLHLLEATLFVYFQNPTDLLVADLLVELKDSVNALRTNKTLGNDDSTFPAINALYEMFFLRRIVRRWVGIRDDSKLLAINAGVEVCDLFDSPQFLVLRALLHASRTALQDLKESQVVDAIDEAAKNAPMHFPSQTMLVLRSAFPFAAAPTGGFRTHEVRARSPDTIGALMQQKKKSRVELVFGSQQTKSREVVERVGAPHGPNPAGKQHVNQLKARMFPCKSTYHATFAAQDKHASSECQFCSGCHVMEFLFNGCTRDCTWNHYPTQRKIATHLRRFPAVFQLAGQRMEDLVKGVRLHPVELPK